MMMMGMGRSFVQGKLKGRDIPKIIGLG